MNEAPTIGLFDLDGTLADFDKAMSSRLDAIRSPTETDLLAGENDLFFEERWRLIKNQPGFWSNLERIDLGFDVYQMTQKLNFENHILTKGPGRTISAWTEKVLWCQQHVPDALITITQKKSLVYGRVLVDDWPSYVLPWLEHRPRGLVIMVAQRWNVGIEHPNIIRYTGDNKTQVWNALVRARDRKDGEALWS